jgi:DNA polymerase-3 subunit alpha
MIKKDDGEDEGEQAEQYQENETENQIFDGMQVKFGGIITDIKKTFTKKDNKEMAILTVEDIYGSIDCLVFPNAYSRLKSKIEVDKIAIFSGKISIRDGEAPSVLIENISEVAETKPENSTKNQVEAPKETKKVLWLKFDSTNTDLLNSVKSILNNYVGETEVRIRCSKLNKTFMFSAKVNANNLLQYELSTIIPEENIKLV